MELGKLRFVPVTQAIGLVGGPVQRDMQSTDVSDGLWVSEIDPGLADTAAFCEHYEISMRMAELSLLPAVRAAGEDTLIVADGTSCRHQIADGTRATQRREALHAVRVLAAALA